MNFHQLSSTDISPPESIFSVGSENKTFASAALGNLKYSQLIDMRSLLLLVSAILVSSLHLDIFYYSHDTPKWLIFDVATSLYIIYSLRSKALIQFSYAGAMILALSFLMLTSIWFAAHKIAGIEFTIRFINASLFAYCLLQNYTKDELTKLLIRLIFWSALAFSLIFITERYILAIDYNAGNFSPAGYINNAGALFNLWIPGLVLYIYQNRHRKIQLILSVFSLFVVVSILMEAATRGTILGLSISELVVFAMMLRTNIKKSFMFLSITTLLLIGIGIYQVSDSLQQGKLSSKISLMKQGVEAASSGRLNMFTNTVEMTVDNPFGVGINNFEYIHPRYAKPGTDDASPWVSEHYILRTPHNIVLKIYSELGYIGGTMFLALLCYLFIIAFLNAYYAGYIDKWLFVGASATLIHSMLSAVLLTPASLFFSAILFAVITARFIEHTNFKSSVKLRLPSGIKLLYLFVPVLSVLAVASEYYGYQGRINFDEDMLRTAVTLNPGNDRALLNLSQVRYQRLKDLPGSLRALDQFLSLYPYHIQGLMLKAERHYQLGELENANFTVTKLLNFYPDFAKAQRLKQLVEIKIKQKQDRS